MQKKIIVNFLVSLIAVFVVLSVAEIILQSFWEMGGWVKGPLYQRNSSPYLRYELVPGAKSGNVLINSAGFRGPEYPLNKPDNTFRIAMLGDSETLNESHKNAFALKIFANYIQSVLKNEKLIPG